MAVKKSPPTLTRPWVSMTEIKAKLTRARDLHSEASKRLAEMNGRVENRRKELDSSLYDLAPAQRAQVVGRALGGLRADLKRSSLDARTARIRELDALRRSADDARSHYNSSVQMLARDSLGSERRSRLMQQLEHSGDAELASLAALAVSVKDRELGAVLVSRVQRIPHAARPFSPHEFADLLVGDEHRAIQAAIMEVEEIAQRAILDDRAFETGRPSPEGGIALALRARERAALDAGDIQHEDI